MIGQRCVQQQIKAEIENRSLARFIILVGDVGIEGKRRIVEAWVDDPNVYKGTGVQSRKELYGN